MVDWPGVVEHFKWGNHKERCGPVIMSMGADPEANCPCGHPRGCAAHQRPKVRGVPFDLRNYKDELVKLGLTTHHQELRKEWAERRKPPGEPTRVGGAMLYPARHFGQPVGGAGHRSSAN